MDSPEKKKLGVDFGFLWTATFSRGLAQALSTFAVPVIAVTLFDASALDVGLLVAASRIGAFFASIVAGALEGSRPPRDELRVFQLIATVLCLGAGIGILAGLHSIWILAAFNLLAGVLASLYSVAHISTLPRLVGRERMPEANARLEAANVSSDGIGPAVAGVITGAALAPIVFIVSAVFHLISIVALTLVKAPAYAAARDKDHVTPARAMRRFWQRARSGYGHVFTNPVLRMMTVGNMLRNFALGFLIAVETIVVLRIAGLTEIQWGIIFGAAAVVGFFVTFLGARVRDAFGEIRTGTILGFLFPIPLVGFALAPVFPTATFALILISELLLTMLVTLRAISVAGTRARVTPDDRLRGANAANRVLNTFPMPIGALIGGALAAWTGEVTMIWLAAALMLLAAFYGLIERTGRSRDVPRELIIIDTPVGA